MVQAAIFLVSGSWTITKTGVTYEWSDVQARSFHHHVCHELKNGFLGKLFLLLPCITTNKVKIHEETSVVNNCFDFTWTNAHKSQFLWCTVIKQRFWAPVAWRIWWYPSFNCWAPLFTKNKAHKEVMDFFKLCNYIPNLFQCSILKNLYCAIIMFGFCRFSHKWLYSFCKIYHQIVHIFQ